ncbi:MAG: glycosyltransferase [Burkholderiales bacterium]|nr:glycosyltransferase [Burkholderiales bacterium]
MKVLYSFNKSGAEAEFWGREIAQASTEGVTFLPFNHDPYLSPNRYLRAQQLDALYYARDPGLMRLYADVESRVREERVDVMLVDTCPPYHPDWLRRIPAFKVLRIADGPLSAYDRDFAYAHAYGLVLYHSPAYSSDMQMGEKLQYIGARRTAFWPLGVFDAAFDPTLPEDKLLSLERDIDVVFVGALHLGKMPFLAKVKKALGSRCRMHGLASVKKNLYFNMKYGLPGWVTPIAHAGYVPLYQRAKLGFNVHNRGKFTVGSYRLFELPANGVMQLSDGDEYLSAFFDEGNEIVGYKTADDLIDKIRFYLDHDDERKRIAANAHRRVMRDYRIEHLLHRVANIIREASA